MIPQYCIAHSFSAEFYARAQEKKMAAFFFTAWLAREINHRFLVNKYGELYFLLHNFGVKLALFELDNLKKSSEGKTIYLNAYTRFCT